MICINSLDLITLKEGYKLKNEKIIEIKEKKSEMLFPEDYDSKKEYYYKELEKYEDIGIINYWDDEYPDILRKIKDPPVIIYYKGDINLIKTHCVSVVGTRKPSEYGKNCCRDIVNMLKKFTVVSGLAYGIDLCAHENSEKTIAVLGCGVDIIYPAGNRKQYERIVKEGLVISEFFPGTKPTPYTFPYRNRIIAGLSETSIIIEAAKKSGSLITANYAATFGREVLAVPGDINRKNSEGTNYLIFNGATPLISLEFLKNYFALDVFSQNYEMTEDEEIIYKMIKNNINSVDKIVFESGKPSYDIITVLMNMQIKGIIKESEGTYYLTV
ncbi:MAG: DNA-protecting protein DprA [Thermotogae bacterium]|nr:DNA-protecting protein DprA [Thermotogota bacterium]HOO75823.1 DNA-processing protein DprA [Tepiditoga sp.]